MVNDWNNRRVFVTGATGLLGSSLTRKLLENGAEVVTLIKEEPKGSPFVEEGMRRRVIAVDGVLEDYELLTRIVREHNPEIVFHLGAQTLVGVAVQDPMATFEANIRGTYHLLEACRLMKAPPRIVSASSDKAYGTSPVLPYGEEMPLHGLHPYDASKSCMDILSQVYHKTYNLPVCIVRSGNIFGPGDLHWSRIVPGTIKSIWKNERPVIRSDGTFTRDYLFVDDVADAYLSIADEMHRTEIVGQAFNLGPAKPLTVLEVVSAIVRLMKKDLQPVIENSAKHEIPHQYLSGAKMKKLLDWSPRHTFEEGLEKTIPWYVRLLEAYANA